MSLAKSKDDPGSVVNIVSWFLLVATTLAVIARMATKQAVSHKFSGDDVVVLAALVLSISQTIVVSLQTASGLGLPLDILSLAKVERFQKSSYTSDLLYIATLTCAKLSVVALIRMITPVKTHRVVALVTGVVTIAWGMTSVLVMAFQCKLPYTWAFIGNQCIQRTAFWTYFEILNIVTDSILVLLPFAIFQRLNANISRRAALVGSFGTRTFVIAATIVRLVYLNRESNPRDPTLTNWTIVLCAQVVQNLSIITACVPYLKPFLKSLESGMLRSDDIRRRGDTLASGSLGYDGHKLSNLSSKQEPREPTPINGVSALRLTTADVVITSGGQGEAQDWDTESQRSSSRIINTSRTWAVERT